MKGPKGCTEFCCLCRIALHVGVCFVFKEFCFCLSCQCFLLPEVNMCWISFDQPLLNIFRLPHYFLSLPEAHIQWLCLVVKLLVHHAVQMFPIRSVKESTYVPCLLCTLLCISPFPALVWPSSPWALDSWESLVININCSLLFSAKPDTKHQQLLRIK